MKILKKPNAFVLNSILVVGIIAIVFVLAEETYPFSGYSSLGYKSFGLAGLLAVPLLALAVICLSRVYKDRKLSMISVFVGIPILICLLVITGLYIYTAGYNISHEKQLLAARYEVQEITLEQLDALQAKEASSVVYVGREDCGSCDAILPYLEDVSRNFPVQIVYYNTLTDRNTRSDEMNAVLSRYEIDSVPTVILLQQGTLVETFSGEDIFSLETALHKYADYHFYFIDKPGFLHN